MLGQLLQFAAANARATKGCQTFAVRPLHGAKDVGAIPRAADGDEQIAVTGQVLELLHKNAIVTLVVRPRENVGSIVGEAQDLEPLLMVVFEIFAAERPLAEVFAEMRRI